MCGCQGSPRRLLVDNKVHALFLVIAAEITEVLLDGWVTRYDTVFLVIAAWRSRFSSDR